MSRTCTKCKNQILDSDVLDMVAEKYPVCNKCWAEWKEYRVMVMNEMRLDMSMLDHRKLLKKHEKIFAGVLSPEGEIIDYTNEDNRKPDKLPDA
ncbi:MAG TPA: Fe(2+)-trafficking protein [Nitrosarchaeum sp.]|jgi:Fe-S cluster biosynthesis and repair protein YggX|nr:Fe(2+)-trafficking protein [Nitrosarchaeum sp.]